MTPRRIKELTPAERRRAVVLSIVHCVLAAAAIVAVYYVLPLGSQIRDAGAFIRVLLGVGVFAGVMAWEIRRILRANLPQLRAVEAAAVSVAVFLCVYATSYVTLSDLDSGNFTEHLNRTAGLYFAIVTFGTVGYGDIAPRTDLARILVSSQVLGDLVFIALGLRAIFGISKLSLSRGEHGASDDVRD